MKDLIQAQFSGKKVAILGYGREGQSSYHFLRSLFPSMELHILDENQSITADAELIQDRYAHLHYGKGYTRFLEEAEIVIKAPGVPFRVFPPSFDRSRITSQTSLFLQQYHSQVIGVTGTKGKSTTASLIHHILSQSGRHSLLVGNIGLPPFEGIHEISPATVIVMELSSHQLEFIRRSPHIAILLNIFQEHLDHYASYSEYQQAKLNIGRYQDASDHFIYSRDNALLKGLVEGNPDIVSELLPYSLDSESTHGISRIENEIVLNHNGRKTSLLSAASTTHLPGDHNFSNIMAAVMACHLAGVTSQNISKGVSTFEGLEHRIEFVAEVDGIKFYNDSIATIPEATIEAVKTLKAVDSLILGGYDRGIDYHILYDFLPSTQIRNLIFIGAAGRRMKEEMETAGKRTFRVFEAGDYEEVVRIARHETAKGKICLLSPAASSYDMFKNFEHRGAIYKKNVRM